MRRYFGDIFCAVLFFILLFFAYQHNIALMNVEILPWGDHASNDMLIQDARVFSLLHGNYSRVGFYHPGPFFFYLLALGEFLLIDIFGLAVAPEAAHYLTVFSWSLILVYFVFRAYRTLSGNEVAALVATLVSIICILVPQPQNLISLWPPNLYILPTLVFLLSAALVLAGRPVWLMGTILSGTVMVHGHASFIGLVPIMTLIFVAVAFWRYRDDISKTTVLKFAHDNKFQVTVFVFLFLVLLLPIVLQVVRDFPGQFGKYLEFAGDTSANNWPSVFDFVIRFWQPVWIIAFGALIFEVLRSSQVFEFDEQESLLAYVVFISSTIALIYYARDGIDDLQHTYVAYWYYSTPSAVAGLMTLAILRIISNQKKILLLVIATSISVSIARVGFPSAPFQMNLEPVQKLATALRLVGATTSRRVPIVLNTKDKNWNKVWANTATVLAYLERKGMPIACVPEPGWHIGFHARNRCKNISDYNGPTVFATTAALASSGGKEVAEYFGLHFYYSEDIPIPGKLMWKDELWRQVPRQFGDGWSGLEKSQVWSDSPTAHLWVPSCSEVAGHLKLRFDAAGFDGTEQKIVILIDDQEVWRSINRIEHENYDIAIPLSGNRDKYHVEFSVHPLLRPSDFGYGDTRTLGIALKEASLQCQD